MAMGSAPFVSFLTFAGKNLCLQPVASIAGCVGPLRSTAGLGATLLGFCATPRYRKQAAGGAAVNQFVRTEINDGVGWLISDNPPVNALSAAVRGGLAEAIERLEADPAVRAIILACDGRTFFAGADIREFDAPPTVPYLPDAIARIEACAKPVIAAIHGAALGGGLEVALGCHYRVADAKARLGLPEVKLGLLPGAGGTQRLPRLIGPLPAVEMILSGEPLGANAALAAGLVDAIAEGDLREAATAMAFRVLAEGKGPRRLRGERDKVSGQGALAAFDAKAEELLARKRGLDAPAACVEAVRNALLLPFDQAMVAERALFLKLKGGEQSRALRHVFFAERAAQKIAGMPAGVRAMPVERVAVIGAGTMGGGIAMAFANAAIPVTLIERDASALERGMAAIRANYERSSKPGGRNAAERMAPIAPATSLGAVADADLVIEAVFEDMAVKKELFGDLGRIAKPGAILATNTSTLDVNVIAQASGRAADVVGMHFFSPANVMRLVEIVRAEATAFGVLATAQAVAQRLGKVTATVGVCYGFVGNRMLHARSKQVEAMLLEGASPAQIDAAATGFGFAMGPCAVGDLAGLDVGWRARKQAGLTAPVADALCEAGRFGQKTGAGYYRYEAGSRRSLPDPQAGEIAARIAAERGVAARAMSEAEIRDRLIYPLINEGAKILAEKIAARPGDIDIIWVHGYGFPAHKGGPMFFADRMGLAGVRDRLAELAGQSGEAALAPAPLLLELAAAGRGFADPDI
jgi:3-hydroxyacyl-CoA dehydrogenase